MNPKLLRAVYMSEFLLALLTVFSAWSEIGGQGALDAMPWGWKAGLGISLAVAIVGITAALVSSDKVWTGRTIRWLALVLVLLGSIGFVTYYYALQSESDDSDDSGTVSLSHLRTS